MNGDPFWRRSGFWVALGASLEALLVVATPEMEPWIRLLIALAIAWGAFFTATRARKSVDVRRVKEESEWVWKLLQEQKDHIARLESLNGMAGHTETLSEAPTFDGTAEDGAPA